eukprot:TRINITY_DN27156_c4_g1_i1.p1 TRINITY_DN27156_c4_g1~~TRINITY_DN27156_c4_g1_i1.p1  ORF type:complete len:497 (+),score=92.40 TRINITY_DN27156_c4_g1_i1:69-1493(+)
MQGASSQRPTAMAGCEPLYGALDMDPERAEKTGAQAGPASACRAPSVFSVLVAAAFVAADLTLNPLFARAASAPSAQAEPRPDFVVILGNSTLMCEYFNFSPEPFWISILKTLCILGVMELLSPRKFGHPYPAHVNIPGFIFALYQCVTVWMTVASVMLSPNFQDYNQRAWGIMYSTAALSLLAAALRLFVEELEVKGDPVDRLSYPGLMKEKLEDYVDILRSAGQHETAAAMLTGSRIPRKWLKVAVGFSLLPLAPCLVTHSCVGAIACAFPLLPLAPALASFTIVLYELFYKPTVGRCIEHLTCGEVPDEDSFWLLVGLFAIAGLCVAIHRFFLSDVTWMPRPGVLGPFVLLGDLAMYCISLFFALMFGLKVRDRFRSAPETSDKKQRSTAAMCNATDTVFRVFLLTVFGQATASYAAMLYEKHDYWYIVDTEWHSREWHQYVSCVWDKLVTKLQAGETHIGVAFSNFAGLF